MADNSLTVWDVEAQDKLGPDVGINRWGRELTAYAVSKGMPQDAKFWTRRHPSAQGTIFEWDNA